MFHLKFFILLLLLKKINDRLKVEIKNGYNILF